MLGVKDGRSDRFMLLPPGWEDWKRVDTHLQRVNQMDLYNF